MSRQGKQALSSELWSYLNGGAAQVMTALGFLYFPRDYNPVWQALAGLSPFTDAEIQELVDADEITEEEGDKMRATQELGKALAFSLEPLIWSSGSPNKRAVMLAYVLAQTSVLNTMNGPLGTRDLVTIRQRWYASRNERAMGFKFAAQNLERYLVQSADVVLVPDEKSMAAARKLVPQRVYFKTDWSKKNSPLPEKVEQLLGRKPNIHTWPKAGWGRTYAQFQSQILADLVRDGLTYEQLWIEDVSRDVSKSYPLLDNFYAVLALEKEGLFSHFQNFCKALGIPILVAMKGNNSFASVEAVLNEHFRDWEGQYKPTEENPLHLFTLTDYDYAGMVPVEGGAFTQFQRYLGKRVVLHRVGISRQQLKDHNLSLFGQGYVFEHDYNSAYWEWAAQMDCECGHTWVPELNEHPEYCPLCYSNNISYRYGIWVGQDENRKCYGIEVEALLPPSLFISYLVDGIIEAMGGKDKFVEAMLKLAEPDWYEIKGMLKGDLYKQVQIYRLLNALKDWADSQANEVKSEAENQVDEWLGDEDDEDAWRNQQIVKDTTLEAVEPQADKITAEAFSEYAGGANKWISAWRPVDGHKANEAVAKLYREGHDSEMKDWSRWYDEDRPELLNALENVFRLLEPLGLEYPES